MFYITERLVLRILYRRMRHIKKVDSLFNMNEKFRLNNESTFFGIGQFRLLKTLLFVCCPEKPFGFGYSLPLENDLDLAKE
jgi:hypothetical protein